MNAPGVRLGSYVSFPDRWTAESRLLRVRRERSCGSRSSARCREDRDDPTAMALTPSTRLGPYEIAAEIGVGGRGDGVSGDRHLPGPHRRHQGAGRDG